MWFFPHGAGEAFPCTSPPYNIKKREISVVGVLPARDLPSWCPCGWFLEFYHGLVYGLWLLSLPRLRRGARRCAKWYSEKYKLDLPLSESDRGKSELILF